MVDFQSHYRLFSYGISSEIPRIGIKNNRENKHEEGRKLFRSRHDRPVHDGRHDVMKAHTENHDFTTWLLSHGLVATYRAVDEIYKKTDEQDNKTPEKLLYEIGETGGEPGRFSFPRGITSTSNCDLIVADTSNHRIQVFNQFGVLVKQAGKQGSGILDFDEPKGVLEIPNGDFAIADTNNKRLQILSDSFNFKYSVPVSSEPVSIGVDSQMNIAIATNDRKIYIFNAYEREMIKSFPISGKSNKSAKSPVQIAVSPESKIFISCPDNGIIYSYSLDGTRLRRFKPQPSDPGLSFTPGAICVTPLGQLLIVDILNHIVNLYTENGEFIYQVLSPTDGAGNIQSLTLGPEGHLIVTEFSIGGRHCMKIFRFRQCPCHEGNKSGSKKVSPAQSPNN